jgi:hypothetical protein
MRGGQDMIAMMTIWLQGQMADSLCSIAKSISQILQPLLDLLLTIALFAMMHGVQECGKSTGLTHQSFLKIRQSQGDLCSKTQHLQQRRSKVAAQSCRNFGFLPRLPQDASIITRMAQQLHCNDTVPSSFL